MFKRIVTLIAACFYYSGLVKLARRWIQRSPRLIILCYHCAGGGDLQKHLRYLRRHYHILSLERALYELYNAPSPEMQGRDRRTPLVLTFDDGYHDNYTHGSVLANKLEIPFTVFLVPGYIESGNRFWWQEPRYLLEHTSSREIQMDNRLYHLDKLDERKALLRAIDYRLRYATSIDERERFLASIQQKFFAYPCKDSKKFELSHRTSYDMHNPLKSTSSLTWDEIQEMSKNKWITFGAHSMHHPILACLTDSTEAQYEVSMCRTVLEQKLGHPIRVFAYPVGGFEHIGASGLQAVQEARYDWALTAIDGFNTSHTNPYLLHRFVVGADLHWLIVAAKISGIWDVFARPLRPLVKTIYGFLGCDYYS
jgi:peptidoglycan/xylan/chitin deacetylase (PgdA/CDA1 family)